MPHRLSSTMTRQSQRHWPGYEQPTGHHPIELENRLTHLEHTTDDHSDQHDQHRDTHRHHDQRLSLIERAILGLAGAVYILAQDRFPEIARLLRGILP